MTFNCGSHSLKNDAFIKYDIIGNTKAAERWRREPREIKIHWPLGEYISLCYVPQNAYQLASTKTYSWSYVQRASDIWVTFLWRTCSCMMTSSNGNISALLALCAGNSPAPHKGQWRGALMFSLIYAWINDWVNNHEVGDLRRRRGHYDVIVMEGISGWKSSLVLCICRRQTDLIYLKLGRGTRYGTAHMETAQAWLTCVRSCMYRRFLPFDLI